MAREIHGNGIVSIDELERSPSSADFTEIRTRIFHGAHCWRVATIDSPARLNLRGSRIAGSDDARLDNREASLARNIAGRASC